jgi:hypothetical protein
MFLVNPVLLTMVSIDWLIFSVLEFLMLVSYDVQHCVFGAGCSSALVQIVREGTWQREGTGQGKGV